MKSLLSPRPWMFLPPVLVGASLLYFASLHESRLESAAIAENQRTLRVIPVPETEFVPRVLGYGVARPQKVWHAVAEVPGKLTYVHPELSAGVIVRSGTKLVGLEKIEYQLALERLKAELRRTRNELAEIDLNEQNLTASLQIEQYARELAVRDVERQRSLLTNNAGSRAQLDEVQRALLQQELKVQAQKHSLDLVPSQRRTLQASIESQESQVADAELDLQKTEILAPFDCRLGDVDIETGQFVASGQTLFEGDGLAATEVVAQVAVEKAATLVDPEQVDLGRMMAVLASHDTTTIREFFKIEATVRARAGDLESSWEARFVNSSSQVDPRTRSVGFLTVVDRPYEKLIAGERPPLVRGVFCEVELRGPRRSNQIVIPQLSIHGNEVCVLNEQSRMERRAVNVEFVQGSLAVLRSGLAAGETLVVSDPTPMIDGQLVDPVVDQELLDSIVLQAAGGEPIR